MTAPPDIVRPAQSDGESAGPRTARTGNPPRRQLDPAATTVSWHAESSCPKRIQSVSGYLFLLFTVGLMRQATGHVHGHQRQRSAPAAGAAATACPGRSVPGRWKHGEGVSRSATDRPIEPGATRPGRAAVIGSTHRSTALRPIATGTTGTGVGKRRPAQMRRPGDAVGLKGEGYHRRTHGCDQRLRFVPAAIRPRYAIRRGICRHADR